MYCEEIVGAETPTKTCTRCKRELPMTREYFHLRKNGDKFRTPCIECRAEQHAELAAKRPKRPEPTEKTCRVCNRSLPITIEHWRAENCKPSRRKPVCRECQSRLRKEDRINNRDKYLERERSRYAVRREQNKEKWRSDPDFRQRSLEANKDWHKKNAERRLQINREWRAANPDKVRAALMRQHAKIMADPIKSVRSILSKEINNRLKRVGVNKDNRSISELLDFTAAELVEHLERQFTKKMNWGNRGRYWEIDHIIPHSSFDIKEPGDDEFRAAWALTNLRPLEKMANRKKGARRTLLL